MVTTFLRYHFPAILWAAVILFLTLLPSESLPKTPKWELLSFDTLAHIGVFGLLAFLLIRSLYFHYGGARFLQFAMGLSVVICFFLGVIIELLQTVMKRGRHGETGDVIADAIGIFLGSVLFYFLSRRKLIF
ncbi:VanZ family protein [Adhaeribacter terreus]|uniref:VanZ family protein n=1 Tax=Adhaeribacter terreus TaxID=529703 RepID=A0ABW0E4K9_9BACT